VDRRAAQTEQRLVDTAAHDLQHVRHALLAGGGHPPQVGPTDHHGAGTEGAITWPGYMDGAFEAGERAASDVLAALR